MEHIYELIRAKGSNVLGRWDCYNTYRVVYRINHAKKCDFSLFQFDLAWVHVNKLNGVKLLKNTNEKLEMIYSPDGWKSCLDKNSDEPCWILREVESKRLVIKFPLTNEGLHDAIKLLEKENTPHKKFDLIEELKLLVKMTDLKRDLKKAEDDLRQSDSILMIERRGRIRVDRKNKALIDAIKHYGHRNMEMLDPDNDSTLGLRIQNFFAKINLIKENGS